MIPDFLQLEVCIEGDDTICQQLGVDTGCRAETAQTPCTKVVTRNIMMGENGGQMGILILSLINQSTLIQ